MRSKLGDVAGAVIVVGALLRAWVVFHLHPPEASLYSDMAFLHERALRLAAGEFVDSDLQKQLGYSLFFAAFVHLEHWVGRPVAFPALGAVQWLVSCATLVPAWWTARWWLGERWGLVALAALAAHPYWVGYAAAFLPETFVIAIATCMVWWITEKGADHPASAPLLGAGWGLALWLKGSLVPWIAIAGVLWLATSRGARPVRRMVVVGGLTLLPVALGTTLAYGHPSITSVEGGLNFAIGHCPTRYLSDGAYQWCPTVFAEYGLCGVPVVHPAPFSDQLYYWREGMSCIMAAPGQALAGGLFGVVDLLVGNLALPFWSPQLHSYASVGQDLFGWLVVPLLPLGAGVAWRRHPERAAWLVSFPLALAVTAILFFGETRFRTVVDLPLVVLAGLGWRQVRQWL